MKYGDLLYMNYSDSSVNTFNERKMIPASSKLPFKFILILLLSDLSSCFFIDSPFFCRKCYIFFLVAKCWTLVVRCRRSTKNQLIISLFLPFCSQNVYQRACILLQAYACALKFLYNCLSWISNSLNDFLALKRDYIFYLKDLWIKFCLLSYYVFKTCEKCFSRLTTDSYDKSTGNAFELFSETCEILF